MVQALPVLRLIKRHLPHSQIYWWIESGLAPLLERDPDLAGLFHFRRQRWAAPSHWRELWRMVRGLRDQAFDWVIDLQSLMRSGAFAWLANGSFTIGLDDRREGAAAFYDLSVPRPSFHTHAVDWYLTVLPALGVPVDSNFDWLPSQPATASELRRKWPITEARWMVLQPGARWLNKRWPVEYFAELVRQLAPAFPDFRFAILGGADDAALGEIIARAEPARCLDLTGKLSLPEMVEWVRLSELMVTNDTGPMHVAAALAVPVVALLGPTEPRRTGPYRQGDHVLQLNLPCVPCLRPRCAYIKPLECLRALPTSAVVAAVGQRLRGSKSKLASLEPVPKMEG